MSAACLLAVALLVAVLVLLVRINRTLRRVAGVSPAPRSLRLMGTGRRARGAAVPAATLRHEDEEQPEQLPLTAPTTKPEGHGKAAS